MLSNILDRLRARQQGIGRARLALYAVVWLVRTLSLGWVELHYRFLLMQPVPAHSLLRGRNRGLRVVAMRGRELVRAFDGDRDGAFTRPPRDRARFLRRVERGDVCIVASRGARIEGILWLTFGTFDESDLNCEFVVSPEQGMVWDSEMYILESARGGLVFAALWDGAYELLRGMDYRWIATQTSAFNGPSLQSQARMGCRRIGRMVYLRVGRSQVTFSTLAPRFDVVGPGGRGPVCRIPAPPCDGAGLRGVASGAR